MAFIRLLLTAVLICYGCVSCQGVRQEDRKAYLLYEGYAITIPKDNYVIISMRSFGPDNYMVFDLTADTLSIYSPYSNEGELLKRTLTSDEAASIRALFDSGAYFRIPGSNAVVGNDLQEIAIVSKINGKEKSIHHTLPKDRHIKKIIALYAALNVPRK